jgi:excinuclease ABC subunit B
MSSDQLEQAIEQAKQRMEQAAKDLNFVEAAKHRDEMYELQKQLKKKPASN